MVRVLCSYLGSYNCAKKVVACSGIKEQKHHNEEQFEARIPYATLTHYSAENVKKVTRRNLQLIIENPFLPLQMFRVDKCAAVMYY